MSVQNHFFTCFCASVNFKYAILLQTFFVFYVVLKDHANQMKFEQCFLSIDALVRIVDLRHENNIIN